MIHICLLLNKLGLHSTVQFHDTAPHNFLCLIETVSQVRFTTSEKPIMLENQSEIFNLTIEILIKLPILPNKLTVRYCKISWLNHQKMEFKRKWIISFVFIYTLLLCERESNRMLSNWIFSQKINSNYSYFIIDNNLKRCANYERDSLDFEKSQA